MHFMSEFTEDNLEKYSQIQRSNSNFSMKKTASTIDQSDNERLSDYFDLQSKTEEQIKGQQLIQRAITFNVMEDENKKKERKKIVQSSVIKKQLKKIKLKYIQEITEQIKKTQGDQLQSVLKQQQRIQQSRFKSKAPIGIKIRPKKMLERIPEAECEESACKLTDNKLKLGYRNQIPLKYWRSKQISWYKITAFFQSKQVQERCLFSMIALLFLFQFLCYLFIENFFN